MFCITFLFTFDKNFLIMKITADYYYLLDNEKPIKIIWTKHEKSCVLKLGTEYPTAIVDNDRISGIPITEDELIKLGFEKRESLSYNDWYIGINPITRDWLFYITWLKNPESINAPNVPFYKNGFHKLTYIHELQNLYFGLTNKELRYNE